MNDVADRALNQRLNFFKRLQVLTNKIHSTVAIEQIMLDLSGDICDLFQSERLTIYVISTDKQTLISKVKTGLKSFKDLLLSVSDQSIAGYVAHHKVTLNLADVYDQAELNRYSPTLHFQQAVDQRTGFRSKQMLVAPILDASNQDLLGVVQFINHKQDQSFTQVAAEGITELCETLAIAFTQRNHPRTSLPTKFDYLLSRGLISAAELDQAIASARSSQRDLEQVLQQDYQVKTTDLGQALARYFSVPYESFKADRVVPVDLIKKLKKNYVDEVHWLPINEDANGLCILALDPEHVRSSNLALHFFPQARLYYHVTTQDEFARTVAQFFGADESSSVNDLLSDLDHSEDDEGKADTEINPGLENELVKLVNKVISDAYQQGASDIHIEPRPGKEKTQIRFRKDGALEPYIEVPASYRSALLARIKIMCDLDISEKRKPQDGKIKFKKYGKHDIELRVATIPTAGGLEDVVMRILAAGEPLPLEKLGILPHNLQRLLPVIEKPYGLFFVCGPTGSGKTTTLHSVLHHLNRPDTKIWTAEDPVEITQKGLRQVQVNRKAGLDFATVMRAFLRADPDIIMVGEMRDKETVSIGLEASLTGHLVLATLHTNSAPESIIRLLDMGMDPFNFADALLGILAQRLARRLCSQCKQSQPASKEQIQQVLDEYCQDLQHTASYQANPAAFRQNIYQRWQKDYGDTQGRLLWHSAVGCEKCSQGYKGRVGLHELMVANDAIKRQIQDKARVAELFAQALADGMWTLKMDGIEKAWAGLTDLKQVKMVCIK